jgi:putative Holliday junction resolvase
MSRILGIDLGERRVGLAVADAGVGIARPLTTVARGRDLAADAQILRRVCAAEGVTEIVVGLPVEASGVEGPMATAVRRWIDELGPMLGLPISVRDERLSSFEAERRLGRMPRGRTGGPPSRTRRNAFRARIDREAAAIILQDELDARRATGAIAGDPE